jgi:hypothetical protein
VVALAPALLVSESNNSGCAALQASLPGAGKGSVRVTVTLPRPL